MAYAQASRTVTREYSTRASPAADSHISDLFRFGLLVSPMLVLGRVSGSMDKVPGLAAVAIEGGSTRHRSRTRRHRNAAARDASTADGNRSRKGSCWICLEPFSSPREPDSSVSSDCARGSLEGANPLPARDDPGTGRREVVSFDSGGSCSNEFVNRDELPSPVIRRCRMLRALMACKGDGKPGLLAWTDGCSTAAGALAL